MQGYATVSTATVLAIIAERDELRAKNERLQGEVSLLRTALEASHQHAREYPKLGCPVCDLLYA